MNSYLNFLRHILQHGVNKSDRTGIGTRSIFGYDMRFDLQAGFPLLTTKKIHFKSVVHELLWFLQGSTHIGYLQNQGVRIWNEWANAEGELGPIYGKQWRSWQAADGNTIDQLQEVLTAIRQNPNSRRLIVSAWNVGDLPYMALPPCHIMFQFYVADGKLSCKLTQRSADAFLGVPFNIASYALLTHMVAAQCGLQPGEFIWSGGDCHIYSNHMPQVNLQLQREPLPLPKLFFSRHPPSLFEYQYEDVILEAYHCHPTIPATVAV